MSALLKSLQEKWRTLNAESDAVLAKEAPTDDERVRVVAIVKELKELKPHLEAAREAGDLKAWGEQTAGMLVLNGPPATDDGDKPDPEQVVVKMWAEGRTKDVPAGALQIARELYGDSYEQTAWNKWRDFNRYLRTGDSDPKLARVLLLSPKQMVQAAMAGVSIKEIKTTMTEADDVLGGYLVPEDVRLDIIERLPGMTVVRKRATVMSTNRDRVQFPKKTGGNNRYTGNVRWTWVDEQPTATEAETNQTWGQQSIPVHTAMGSTPMSRNLLEDAASDVVGSLTREFSESAAIDEDQMFLTGDGQGRPEGILNGTAASGAPFDADVTTVNAGNASALTGDGVVAVPHGLAKQYRQGSVFVMTKATHQEVRQLKDSVGRYLWASNESNLGTNPFGAPLLGFEVDESEAMPEIAANTYPIIFGNFRGYRIVDRVGMSIERFIDATTARQNLVYYVARRRLGGQVAEGWAFVVQLVAA